MPRPFAPVESVPLPAQDATPSAACRADAAPLGRRRLPLGSRARLSEPETLTLEEACEVIDAIDGGDREEHKAELGDLLLQVVFQAS